MNPIFERYIGIDYSGAQTPSSSLKGLGIYIADRLISPQEVLSPLSPRKHWTRKGIAEWLDENLSNGPPTLVGIDHGFHSRCNTSSSMDCYSTGHPSSTISSATGRPTRTFTSILSVTVAAETVRLAQAILAGGG